MSDWRKPPSAEFTFPAVSFVPIKSVIFWTRASVLGTNLRRWGNASTISRELASSVLACIHTVYIHAYIRHKLVLIFFSFASSCLLMFYLRLSRASVYRLSAVYLELLCARLSLLAKFLSNMPMYSVLKGVVPKSSPRVTSRALRDTKRYDTVPLLYFFLRRDLEIGRCVRLSVRKC